MQGAQPRLYRSGRPGLSAAGRYADGVGERASGGAARARAGVRIVLGAMGLAVGANAAWLAATANWTLGTALVGVTALALGAVAMWLPGFLRARWPLALAGLVVAAVVALSGFLAGYGLADTVRGDEDAVIVLGAAVHGRELSRTLTTRLEVALEFHAAHPDALLVVSGGQGPQEDLPEADAMRAYLIARGVPEDRILAEPRSTSTEENFAFSKALLDARLAPGYRVAFATNEFHVYRAQRIAAGLGLTATHLAARTPWYFWAPNYLRESLVVVGSWVGR